jgi:hypothetical protein
VEVRCTQCGAAVPVAPDVRLLSCPFCGTALAVAAEGAVFHEGMVPTVGEQEAVSHLKRFLAGDQTVAHLDREARIGKPTLEYFPFWGFRLRSADRERTVLMPAAPSSLQGLQGLMLPAGETRQMTEEAVGSVPVIEPDVPLETAEQWLRQREPSAAVSQRILYHLPLYTLHYSWKNRSYRAGVDAVSGRVFPSDFPAKSEAPYLLVAGLSLMVFGLEGLVIGNLLLKVAVFAVSAVPLMGLAWLTTRNV